MQPTHRGPGFTDLGRKSAVQERRCRNEIVPIHAFPYASGMPDTSQYSSRARLRAGSPQFHAFVAKFRRAPKLVLRHAGAIGADPGIVFQRLPWQRIVIAAQSQEPTKTKHSIGYMITRSTEPIFLSLARYTAVPSTLSLPIRFSHFLFTGRHPVPPLNPTNRPTPPTRGRSSDFSFLTMR
jgi:hypothetical protein